MDVKNDPVLQGYQAERAKLTASIDALATELRTLDRLIAERNLLLTTMPVGPGLTKKNSGQRYFCTQIAEELSRSKEGIKTKRLHAMLAVTFKNLKYTTFRHYVHWMKKRGLIFKKHGGTEWYVRPDWKERL